MPKNKSVQKGVGKQQQRPGTEQVRSGMQIQKDEGEQLQQPKSGGQLKHQQQGKSGRK
ncbi:hypothetical protein [Geomonas sp.]|uniref:hypothetical protein n=1 Tax=Geomonas sp. TaxID=2651584 RepID=UPI002B47CA4F|nr:hypothetical protein [Geomonas sp.]HJV36136.1 hypothetical protein [Geomonas sp.]